MCVHVNELQIIHIIYFWEHVLFSFTDAYKFHFLSQLKMSKMHCKCYLIICHNIMPFFGLPICTNYNISFKFQMVSRFSKIPMRKWIKSLTALLWWRPAEIAFLRKNLEEIVKKGFYKFVDHSRFNTKRQLVDINKKIERLICVIIFTWFSTLRVCRKLVHFIWTKRKIIIF